MGTDLELLALDARTGRLGDANPAQTVDEVLAQTVELSALVGSRPSATS